MLLSHSQLPPTSMSLIDLLDYNDAVAWIKAHTQLTQEPPPEITAGDVFVYKRTEARRRWVDKLGLKELEGTRVTCGKAIRRVYVPDSSCANNGLAKIAWTSISMGGLTYGLVAYVNCCELLSRFRHEKPQDTASGQYIESDGEGRTQQLASSSASSDYSVDPAPKTYWSVVM